MLFHVTVFVMFVQSNFSFMKLDNMLSLASVTILQACRTEFINSVKLWKVVKLMWSQKERQEGSGVVKYQMHFYN